LRAIIVADGDIRSGAALHEAVRQAREDGDTDESVLVIAADGGAMKAEQVGLTPTVVVGDGDSLDPHVAESLARAGAEVIVYPVDKDESDTELAVREALARGARSVLILGWLGGMRQEHSIANLMLLTLPALAGLDAALIDGPTTIRAMGMTGPDVMKLDGVPGDYISLLPLTEEVHGVTTTGLRFPLADATLSQGGTRGLSNEMLTTQSEVRTSSGRLAVIHTTRTEVDSHE
jgi:thiamine pyrophosphokinase